jgi:nucleotide-binding universal stress UspA family protein
MKAADTAVRVRFKNILFATDFSDAAAHAIPYLREIAKQYDADVLALHVRPLVVDRMTYSGAKLEDVAGSGIQDEQHRQELLAAFPGIRTKILIEEGSIDYHLQSAIRKNNVDLVVIGTRGRTGVGKLPLGSVAEEIFRTVTCPVLTVGPHSSPSNPSGRLFREILCATDQASGNAAAHALSLSQEFGSRLVLLNAIAEEEAGSREPSRDLLASSKQLLRRLMPSEAESLCKLEYVVRRGDLAETILEFERERNPDLIVLGARPERGVHGVATHLPIATAHKIVSQATCPVLTVRL